MSAYVEAIIINVIQKLDLVWRVNASANNNIVACTQSCSPVKNSAHDWTGTRYWPALVVKPAQGKSAQPLNIKRQLCCITPRLVKGSCRCFCSLVGLWFVDNNNAPLTQNGQTLIIFNAKSVRPSDAYMRHQPRQSLGQMMVCRLFGAMPLSEPMLCYCQLDS